MACRFAGTQKALALDVYLDATLAAAREGRTVTRKPLAADIDATTAERNDKAVRLAETANTF